MLSIPLALPGLSRQGCWRAHPRLGILAAIYKAIAMSLSNPLFLPWQQVPKVHYLPCPEVLSFICLKLNLSLFSIERPSFFHYRIWRTTVLRPAYPLPSGFPNPQPNPPSAFSTSAWQAAPSPTRAACHILSHATGPPFSLKDCSPYLLMHHEGLLPLDR